MSTPSNHRRITAFLLVAVVLMLACGVSTSSSGSGSAATQAALQLQGTAMVLQLTQAALNVPAQVQPVNPPAAGATENTAGPTPNTGTATVAPRIVLDLNSIEITYGQALSGYPRKNQGTIYGFKGTQDDNVTILLTSSSARPATDPKCLGLTASTNFTLKTPKNTMPAIVEATHLATIRDLKLPATGAYYVTVTCGGNGCNGYCFQADLAVNKN
jgi:hypothetical protein